MVHSSLLSLPFSNRVFLKLFTYLRKQSAYLTWYTYHTTFYHLVSKLRMKTTKHDSITGKSSLSQNAFSYVASLLQNSVTNTCRPQREKAGTRHTIKANKQVLALFFTFNIFLHNQKHFLETQILPPSVSTACTVSPTNLQRILIFCLPTLPCCS